MTVHVMFYAEQAYLSFVKRILDSPTDNDSEIENGAMCVIACAGAIEAFANAILSSSKKLRHWDELKITSKIDTIMDFTGQTVEWGNAPWGTINRIIYLRNWLAHYKDSYIGFQGADGEWLNQYGPDGQGTTGTKPPKVNPMTDLSMKSVRTYYNATLQAMQRLYSASSMSPDWDAWYDWLNTQQYEPLIVG